MEKLESIVVAPLAGARIETQGNVLEVQIYEVAPLAGARIETNLKKSRLMFGCVAPLAGARIETMPPVLPNAIMTSLPSRERELKPLASWSPRRATSRSLPSRERELKQLHPLQRDIPAPVAPLAGARIETCRHQRTYYCIKVAPLAGARIETGEGQQ